jgi:peptidoglycan/LPS O-acetylase OafA/YrhL
VHQRENWLGEAVILRGSNSDHVSSTATAAGAQTRLRGLDALRGLAALAVCLFHYTYSFPRVTGRAFDVGFVASAGHYGVDLFFIISGFVIFMTLEKSRSAYDFVAARVARIYPAYLAAVMIAIAVLYVANLPIPRPGVAEILAHVSMVPQIFGMPLIDNVYWTLAYEAGFYFFAATVIWRVGLDRIEELCLIWLPATLMLRFEPFVIWRIPYLLQTIRLVTAGSFAMLFMIGILLYRICRGHVRPMTYTVFVAALAVTLAGPPKPVQPMGGIGYFLLIASCAALVWLAGTNRLPLKPLAPLIFLGEISYSLYLVHRLIGFAVIERLLAVGVHPDAAVLIALSIAVLLAMAMNRLVERPGQRAIRAWFARYRGRITSEDQAAAKARLSLGLVSTDFARRRPVA